MCTTGELCVCKPLNTKKRLIGKLVRFKIILALEKNQCINLKFVSLELIHPYIIHLKNFL